MLQFFSLLFSKEIEEKKEKLNETTNLKDERKTHLDHKKEELNSIMTVHERSEVGENAYITFMIMETE